MAVVPITIPVIQKHLDSDRRFRERRHGQWMTNYTLYRDTVTVNRLTQRQSMNVPYMKKTWKTYATQTNWPVDNYYEDKGNDKQGELFLNAYWDECAERLKLDILEEVDRKQEWFYGRSFMKLNLLDGWFHMEVVDPQDVLLDRYMNPWDLNSSRRITHVGIYRTLSDIQRNPLYSTEAINRLKEFFATQAGVSSKVKPRLVHSRFLIVMLSPASKAETRLLVGRTEKQGRKRGDRRSRRRFLQSSFKGKCEIWADSSGFR